MSLRTRVLSRVHSRTIWCFSKRGVAVPTSMLQTVNTSRLEPNISAIHMRRKWSMGLEQNVLPRTYLLDVRPTQLHPRQHRWMRSVQQSDLYHMQGAISSRRLPRRHRNPRVTTLRKRPGVAAMLQMPHLGRTKQAATILVSIELYANAFPNRIASLSIQR